MGSEGMEGFRKKLKNTHRHGQQCDNCHREVWLREVEEGLGEINDDGCKLELET